MIMVFSHKPDTGVGLRIEGPLYSRCVIQGDSGAGDKMGPLYHRHVVQGGPPLVCFLSFITRLNKYTDCMFLP